MTLIERWHTVLQDHKYPCFLADVDTREVFYGNEKLLKMMGGSENIIGKVYSQAIKNDNATTHEDTPPNWDVTDHYSMEIYCKALGQGFRTYLTLMKAEEKPIIFCCLAPVDSQLNDTLTFEQTMTQCIAVLQEDDEKRTSSLLEILGKFYDCDKASLFFVEGERIPCVASWRVNETVPITANLSGRVDGQKLFDWFETRNERGIIEADKNHMVDTHNSFAMEALNGFELDNIVMAVVENAKGDAIGMVVVSNRKNMKADFRLLQAVTQFMEKDINNTQMESALTNLSQRDMLTGFYNRSSYAKKLDELRLNPPKQLGVFFANVNGLKQINAEYGYSKGDCFIKKASEIIKEHFKSEIFRISGDEFVAFFTNVDKDEFEKKVLELRNLLKNENNLFALGHAWADGRYDCSQLVNEADTVMYINKQEYYHTSNRRFDEIADSTLSDLLSFLDNDEFMIYLQPQVELKDGSLYGAEALIRRFDKTNQKMVFPDQFIPLYEQKSVIRHVDIFVVETVCKLLVEWEKQGKAIPISVNLSRVTLLEYGIVDTIVKICDKYAVPHHLLVIEVTERVGLIENNVASALIQGFKDNGFHISLDDFGCAYSNIITLAQIEVDEVKIDKSLVDDLTTNAKNRILVKNVLLMCNELEGTSTLAEGIEDEEQGQLLYKLGCRLGQGYFYSRPIPVGEFFEKYIDEKYIDEKGDDVS